MRLVMFCGSAGERSSNRSLLDVVGGAAVDSGWEAMSVEGLASIPMFDPAVGDDAAPEAVAALRNSFETADAVVFAVPEYGGGAAGWVKNALDWMVGSGSLNDCVAAVMSAGTTGGRNAVGQIARTLTWQGAHVVAALGVSAPSVKRDVEGRIVDVGTLAALDDVARRLFDAADDENRRDTLTMETLERLGIPRHDRT